MNCYPNKTGTLCASGYAKLGTQEALNGMYVIQPVKPGDKQMPNYYTMQSFSEYAEYNSASTVKCRDYKGFTDLVQEDHMEQQQKKYVLRRLTPVECARLQGFPDWWCDGANGSDSAQYKLWGNGIALPCAVDVLGRIAMEMKDES